MWVAHTYQFYDQLPPPPLGYQHACTDSLMVNSPNTSMCIATHTVMENSPETTRFPQHTLLQRIHQHFPSHTLYYYYGEYTINRQVQFTLNYKELTKYQHSHKHSITLNSNTSHWHTLLWRIHQKHVGCPHILYYREFTNLLPSHILYYGKFAGYRQVQHTLCDVKFPNTSMPTHILLW